MHSYEFVQYGFQALILSGFLADLVAKYYQFLLRRRHILKKR
jgi:hypothetical protein